MKRIVVIGGGVSGMSAGIYARINGFDTVICEKHSTVGGNLCGWTRDGYHIDNCIHWLTGTNPHSEEYRMWNELGVLGDVRVLQGNTLYSCGYGGDTLSLFRDINKLEQRMLELSPEDSDEIRRLIHAVDIMQRIGGIGGDGHDEGLGIRQRIYAIPLLMRYYRMTTGELSKCFSHPLLRKFISAFWGNEFGSLALLMVFAAFCGENGGIPAGGSCGMAKRMEKQFAALGGEVLCDREVIRINRRGALAESVDLSDGTRLTADYVVVTCDPAAAFGSIIDAPMPKRLERQYKGRRFKRFSAFQCAFACDVDKLPFEGDYILSSESDFPFEIKQVILREFSHETDYAPEGKNVLQCMTFCYENEANEFIRMREADKMSYDRKKRELSELFEKLIITDFPILNGKLRLIDAWTPATYKRYTGAEIGSFMSFALPAKCLPFRITGAVDGIENLFIASQWQQLPGGLPIAASCGRKAVSDIMRREVFLSKRKKNCMKTKPMQS